SPYTGTGTFTKTEPVKGTFAESFTVTDANAASASGSAQVAVTQQPFVVSVSCGSSTAAITAGKPFSCTVSATGGTEPYTVTDANQKSAVASTTVTVVQQPFTVSVDCGSDQTAGKPFSCTVSATGGTAPYGGTGSFSVTQPVKGSFIESFTVTDANGKSAVA